MTVNKNIWAATAAGILAPMLAVALWYAGPRHYAIVIGGVWAMAMSFFGGLALIRFLLGYGHPVTGVARTLVDEAIRMKIALVFIIGLILLIPILPTSLLPSERLEYRIQTFLSYSVSGISVLLSFMTIFLACGTISAELRDKQIFLTMSKPVSRFNYLAGKLLGIAMLNLLLIAVSGVAVYSFARLLQQQRAMEVLDRVAVEEHILVARKNILPQMPPGMDRETLILDRFKQLYTEDPMRWGGKMGLPVEDTEELRDAVNRLPENMRKEIETAVDARWHTVAPGRKQSFRFTGLADAGRYTDILQLRFKPFAQPQPEDKRIYFSLWVNGRPYHMNPNTGVAAPIVVTAGEYHVIQIPTSFIEEDGVLDIIMGNENPVDPRQNLSTSVNFPPNKGVEVLYRVGGFEGNLTRTLTIIWLRLVFLAVMGLTASTFLGFPVACLFSFLIYVVAIASGFLTESLGEFAAIAPADLTVWRQILWTFDEFFTELLKGELWEAVKLPIRLFGETIVLLVPDFSRFNPVPLMADGRVVPGEMLGEAVLWLGVIWSGLSAFVAWAIFRKRELARVIV